MRLLLGCFCSAVFGSLLTIWLTGPAGKSALVAQDRPVPEQLSPIERVSPATKRVFNSEGHTPDEAVTVAVYEAVNRSVVNITAKSVKNERSIWAGPISEGSGSGAVIDLEGNILTNHHVVGGAKEIAVTLYNGETYDAVSVGSDPLNDLAVIRIDAPAEELSPVTFGDSKSLRVGMNVFALGNPFGLERTLTTGIISSLNRSLQIHGNWKIKSIIQIDAAINPGSSGGPLLDSHGRLIGINTAIATTSGQSSGVGFAIPVSLISRVVPQLLKHHRVIRPESGIDKVYQTDKGLLIAELRPNCPAEKAGLRGPKMVKSRRGPLTFNREDRSAADLIVGLDDQKISSAEDFLSYIEGKSPGEQVTLTVVRDGRKVQVAMTLGSTDSMERPE